MFYNVKNWDSLEPRIVSETFLMGKFVLNNEAPTQKMQHQASEKNQFCYLNEEKYFSNIYGTIFILFLQICHCEQMQIHFVL